MAVNKRDLPRGPPKTDNTGRQGQPSRPTWRRGIQGELLLTVELPPNPLPLFLRALLSASCPGPPAPGQAADISYYPTFLSVATSWKPASVWMDADSAREAGLASSPAAGAPPHPRGHRVGSSS